MSAKLNLLIASFGGTGFLPLAPGTYASFLAAVLFWYSPFSMPVTLLILSVVITVGTYTAGKTESQLGKDPSQVVIDEVAGQWLALLFLPREFLVYLAAFLIFRALDILKPPPIRQSQNLPGGAGIMADDILAGLSTNIIVHGSYYFLNAPN